MKIFSLFALFVLFSAACATVSEPIRPSRISTVRDVNQLSDSEFVSLAFPIAQTLVKSVTEGSPKRVLSHCTLPLRERFSEDAFQIQARQIRENYGFLTDFQPGMNCRQTVFRSLICKAVFRFKTKTGQIEIREIPCTVHFAFEDEQLRIFSFTLSPNA